MIAERRRHVRHKVHSPAYASIAAGAGGVVLDANEAGVALESVAELTPQSQVELRLDLLEAHGTAVTPARVAWSGEGRAGLEFLGLTGESRRQLQQWLLLNALLAAESARMLTQTPSVAAPQQDQDAVLRSMTERSLAASAAQGAAIALAEGEEIICRATAGEIAPPPGARLDTQSGISGACVREGRWLRCDDAESDSQVDRESCAALGINSVLAVPVTEQGRILGLIEVFSRHKYAFSEDHCSALQAIASELARSLPPRALAGTAAAAQAAEMQAAPARAALEPAPEPQLPLAVEAEAAKAASAVVAGAEPPPPAATAVTQPAEAMATAPAPAEAAPGPPPATAAAVPAGAAGAAPAAAAIAEPLSELQAAPAATVSQPAVEGESAIAASQPLITSEAAAQPPPGMVAARRVVLIAVVAVLALVALWWSLARNTAGRGNVDAAESGSASESRPQAARSGTPLVAEMPSSFQPLLQRAEAGDADAQFELGAKYASGEEVGQDYPEAVKWFTRAAESGQVLAAATLGAYYWAGRGVPRDDVAAYVWSAIARSQGDEASRYRLAILRAHMTAQQIAEAEQKVAEWQRLHARSQAAGSAAQP